MPACQNGPVTEGSDKSNAGLDNGGPSVTARRVAAYRLGFTRVPAPYGDAAADEALAADVAAGEEPAAGRMREYLDARTRFFDRVVVGAIGRGVSQIVVGAAGYDGRAFRYAKSGVRWFEIDLPATQRDKRERLARLGLSEPRQVRFVEADFTRDPVAERLTSAGLNTAQASLFLLEGVAVYLEPAVLERVLRQFRQVARAGSRLAISVSRSGTDREARLRFQASVATLGEPARSALEAGEATELLAHTGWRVTAADDANDPDVAARRERLRSAGLLIASAGPRPAPAPRPAQRPPPGHPANSSRPDHHEGPSPYPLCCPRRSSRSPSSSTTRPNTAPRTARRTTAPATQGDGPWLVSLAMFENCLRYRHRPARHRRRARDSRPYRDQPGRHAPLGLHHHRRNRPEDPQESPRPRRRPPRHRPGPAGPADLAAAARPHRAALAGALRRGPDRPAPPLRWQR